MKCQEEIVKFVNEILSNDVNAIAKAIVHPLFYDKPLDGWSAFNRALVLSRTSDARGIKQWNAVGRRVKRGARALRIFVPIKKVVAGDVEGGAEAIKSTCPDCEVAEKIAKKWFSVSPNTPSYECLSCENLKKMRAVVRQLQNSCRYVVTGFFTIPVFAVEDTEGEPLREDEVPDSIPFDVKAVARALGVSVFLSKCPSNLVVWRDARNVEVYGKEVHPILRALTDAASTRLYGVVDEPASSLASSVLTHVTGGTVSKELLSDFVTYVKSLKSWGAETLNVPDTARILHKLARADKIVRKILEVQSETTPTRACVVV